MVQYNTTIKRFSKNGEKTGWTYIEISQDLAEKLNPGVKKSYRVKGKLDNCPIQGISLLPMGEGNFIMALNAKIRKGIKKDAGDKLKVCLEVDLKEKKVSEDLIECLHDEPKALEFFKSLTKSHQNYFSNWIESAKTDNTKVKRITQAVNALTLQLGFPEMIRLNKKKLD